MIISKAMESSSDAIIVVDSSRAGVYYNKKFCEMFGYSRAELEEMGGAEGLYSDESFNGA
jgi:PAS domain S-box-containing protein